jgi:hypothetical protein
MFSGSAPARLRELLPYVVGLEPRRLGCLRQPKGPVSSALALFQGPSWYPFGVTGPGLAERMALTTSKFGSFAAETKVFALEGSPASLGKPIRRTSTLGSEAAKL